MNYITLIQKAIDYIERHLYYEVELGAIAEEAYMSLPTLYRVFYALTGHPVKEYVRKRRVSSAALHLRNSKIPIQAIAIDCGFESYHAFTKTFKKVVGITPGQYRSAKLFYSFEAINLMEKVSYLEEKEVSERYQDVKVIRMMPMRVLTYRHIDLESEGIENKAFQFVYGLLLKSGIDITDIRFFGFNFDPPLKDNQDTYGYEIMLKIPENEEPSVSGKVEWSVAGMADRRFPGGLYASCKTTGSSAETMISAWSKLVSDWLPKSTFTLATHPYFEEFILFKSHMTRMNLFLPIEKKIRQEMIELVKLPPFPVALSRGAGKEAQADAERKFKVWLDRTPVLEHRSACKFYMSYSLENHDEVDDYWWEAGISLDADTIVEDPLVKGTIVEGGDYASISTKAYGKLTGVLESLTRWVTGTSHLLLDESRQWFAEYSTSYGMNPEEVWVTCYLPVLTTTKHLNNNKV